MSPETIQPIQFGIAEVLRGMLRRKLLVGTFLGLGLLGGLGLVAVTKPQYASEAQLLISHLDTPFDRANTSQEQRAETIDDRFVVSQVQVIKSEDMMLRVLNSLQLVGKGEFEPLANGIGTLKGIFIALGFSSDPRLMTPEQRAVNTLNGQLTVYQQPESNIIFIRAAGSNPKTAALVANTLAETYVLSTRESQSGPNERARDWLASQIDGLRRKVNASEAAVETFRAEAGLLKGATATLGTQEISELASQITLAETAAGEAKARADEIRNVLARGAVDASADVLNSPVIQRLREQQVQAQQKVSELSATYLPNHPKMQAASREVSNVERQLRREALKIVESLQGQAKVAAARATALRQSMEQLKGREGESLQSDVRLKELEREAAADRGLLESMLARYADANARQDLTLQPGFARVIQTASVAASPFFPKVGPTVMLMALTGLGLGLGLAFLFEIMAQASRQSVPANANDRARVPAPQPHHVATGHAGDIPALGLDAAAHAELLSRLRNATSPVQTHQVLASLPAAPPLLGAFSLLDQGLVGQGLHPVAERIALALAEAAAKSGNKAICVISVGASYEAALGATAICRALAGARFKTMLVDVTAQRPAAMDMLALSEGPGLSDLLAGQADVARVIQRDPKSAVQAMRYGMVAELASRDAVARKMPQVLTTLSQVYDVVVLNAGEASSSTPELVNGCGAALFLAPAARQRDAVAASKTLASKGIRQSFFVKIDDRDATTSVMRQAG
jgi:polysaccharide biosynthesis transport protein